MAQLKKSMRAQDVHLQKEKHQLEAIQIDLGVDLMSGSILRDKVPHSFHSKKDLEKTIEVLANTLPEHRGTNQLSDLRKIIRGMKFFQD